MTSRNRLAAAALMTQGEWVAAAHLPFPGIGHLRAAGSGYIFIPVNYSALH